MEKQHNMIPGKLNKFKYPDKTEKVLCTNEFAPNEKVSAKTVMAK